MVNEMGEKADENDNGEVIVARATMAMVTVLFIFQSVCLQLVLLLYVPTKLTWRLC